MSYNNIKNTVFGRFLAAGFALSLSLFGSSVSAASYQDSETLKLDYGTFNIHGSASKRACSAQANLKSRGGKNTGFAIYWRIGRTIHLLVSHPNNSKVNGKHKANFVFPDGSSVNFPMSRSGNQLQVRIGFGPRGSAFYDSLTKNRSVVIQLPAVGDSVDVDLSERERVEIGMEICRRWQKK